MAAAEGFKNIFNSDQRDDLTGVFKWITQLHSISSCTWSFIGDNYNILQQRVVDFGSASGEEMGSTCAPSLINFPFKVGMSNSRPLKPTGHRSRGLELDTPALSSELDPADTRRISEWSFPELGFENSCALPCQVSSRRTQTLDFCSVGLCKVVK